MSRILLCTHSRMASGMKATVDFLLGESPCLTAVDAYVPEAPDLERTIAQFLEETAPAQTALLVCDIPSGSVNQIMLQCAAGRENVFVIAGVNLPLLQELVLSCDTDFTAQRLDGIIAEARDMLMRVTLEDPEPQDDFFA